MTDNPTYGPGAASIFATHARRLPPPTVKLWCDTCQRERDFALVGPVKDGDVYACSRCGMTRTVKEG